jgi:hypothetical protein
LDVKEKEITQLGCQRKGNNSTWMSKEKETTNLGCQKKRKQPILDVKRKGNN